MPFKPEVTPNLPANAGVAVLSGPIINGGVSSETMQRLTAGADIALETDAPLLLLGGSADFMDREITKRRVHFDPSRAYTSTRLFFRETAGNALEAKDLTSRLGLTALHIVTSDYHTRRAKNIFHRVMPDTDITTTGVSIVGMSEAERTRQIRMERLRTTIENILLFGLGYDGRKHGNHQKLARRLNKVANVRNKIDGLKPPDQD